MAGADWRTNGSRGLIAASERAARPRSMGGGASPRAAKRSRLASQTPHALAEHLMTAHSAVAGVEINAKPSGRQAEILSAEALAFLAGLHRRFNRRRLELAGAANGAPGRFRRRQAAGLSPRDEIHPRARLDGRPDPGRPSGPPGRDHRPGRPQDDRQRAQFRRQGVHGRFRGRDLADVRQYGRGPGQPEGPLGRQNRLHRPGYRARPTLSRAIPPC